MASKRRKPRRTPDDLMAEIRARKQPQPVKAPASAKPTEYPLHPVCADYMDFTPEEADAMRASLRELGLLTPITLWRDTVVDGRHRDLLCREVGIEPRYDQGGAVGERNSPRFALAV